jgi:hypothetical protein
MPVVAMQERRNPLQEVEILIEVEDPAAGPQEYLDLTRDRGRLRSRQRRRDLHLPDPLIPAHRLPGDLMTASRASR